MAPLLGDNPHLSEVVDAGARRIDPRAGAARLAALEPTRGLDLHGSLRSAALRLLVSLPLARILQAQARPRRPALHQDRSLRPARPGGRTLLRSGARPRRPSRRRPARILPRRSGARARRALGCASTDLEDAPLAALAPGAAHVTKRWPVDRWIALAAAAARAGLRDGRGRRRGRPAPPRRAGAARVSAAGAFSLQETGALLARARVAVSGDTGVMHMATGVGTPGRGAVRSHRRAVRILSVSERRPRCCSATSTAVPAPPWGGRAVPWVTTAASPTSRRPRSPPRWSVSSHERRRGR